jgi:hypothetical protein
MELKEKREARAASNKQKDQCGRASAALGRQVLELVQRSVALLLVNEQMNRSALKDF